MSLELGRPRDGTASKKPMMATCRPHRYQLMEGALEVGTCVTKRLIGKEMARRVGALKKKVKQANGCSRSGLWDKELLRAVLLLRWENVAQPMVRQWYCVSLATSLTVTMVRKADYSPDRLCITQEMEGYGRWKIKAALYGGDYLKKKRKKIITRAGGTSLRITSRFKNAPDESSCIWQAYLLFSAFSNKP